MRSRMTHCPTVTKAGKVCGRPLLKGRRVCLFHSVRHDRAALGIKPRRKAFRPITDVNQVRVMLGTLLGRLRAEQASSRDISPVVMAYLKAHELCRDEEIVAKIEKINQQVEAMKLARRGQGIVGGWTEETSRESEAGAGEA